MSTLTQDAASVSATRNACNGAVAEKYCDLVHWLRSVCDLSGIALKTIGVTACTKGAGTSSVALNLAVAAAQITARSVLMLDLSNTRPIAAARFATSDDLNMRDAFVEVLRPGECVKASPITNLSLLAANELGDFQALGVNCGRVGDLLGSLEQDFGFIVVDLPIVESSLCFATAGLLNGMLLVMEAERTHAETAARAKQRLIDARANVFGVILNKHCQHIPNWLNARLY